MKIKIPEPKAIIRKLDQLENFVADFIFPFFCVGCGKEKVVFCDDCQKKIPLRSFQVCPFCEKAITLRGRVCSSCQNSEIYQKTSLDQLIVATSYQDQVVQKAIHLLKYKFIKDLSVPLGKSLIGALLKNLDFVPDLIVPVPLHSYRLRWRGFNQAEILANEISNHLLPPFKIPVEKNLVERKRYTIPQMKIKNQEERMSNIKNAFWVRKHFQEKVRGKKILIVDDVCTTGATIFECASSLSVYLPKKISAIVIARQGK